MNGAKEGTFDATRTFTIDNRSQSAATFQATAQNTPGGATVTIDPASFSLAPAASRTVSVRVVANNKMLAFSGDSLAGGTVRLQSASATIDVPWGLVRAARMNVTYDRPIRTLFAASPTRPRLFYHYAPNAAEMYAPPGEKWDVVLVSDDARVHVLERRPLDDHEQIALHASDATRLFTLDAQDASGGPLHAHAGYATALRLQIDHALYGSDTLNLDGAHELRVTPHSSRIHLAPVEFQLAKSHLYGVVHPELTGEGGTLTESAYMHTRLRRSSAESLRAEANVAYDDGSTALSTILFASVGGLDPEFDLYLSPRVSLEAFPTVVFSGGRESIPLLRATSEGIVPGNGRTLSPVAHRAAHGSEIAIGRGPAFPFGVAAYLGGLGETRDNDKHWTLHDSAGALLAHGDADALPQFLPGSRYVATNNVLRGELAIAFAATVGDLIAPTLTSLRVLDAHGALTDRVRAGEAATLRFSAADLAFSSDFSTRPMRPERTRVSYRAHGATAWIPLQVVIEGAELGTPSSLGHTPAGDIYRVDLAGATAVTQFIDLRIEFEDVPGNRTTWTQLRAFAVGDVVAIPRRRAAR